MIVAKPIVPNKYWILTNEDGKVGQLEATKNGYEVKIKNRIQSFSTIPSVKKKTDITFETIKSKRNSEQSHTVHGFPTDSKVYNSIYDVQKKLPLYTKSPKSKSWYAAGWYLVKVGSRWTEVFCPKLLVLKRSSYMGPVKNKEDLQFK